MAHTLLLRLPAPGSEDTEWLIVDDEGVRTGPRQRGPLSLAAAIAQNHRLVVLVPATEVMLVEPELPPGSGAKLARAVPFALEELVTDDIDTLHFAIGRRGADNTTAVAVVARSLMDAWRSTLQSAGLHPAAMYADVSLMPRNPGQTVLWAEEGRVSVRRAAGPPFTVEVSPIEDALAAAGVIHDEPAAAPVAAEGEDAGPITAPVPEDALLFATPEDWAGIQNRFDRLLDRFASMKVQLLPEGPLVWLARELPQSDAINLLQGDYTSTEVHSSQWRRWRLAAMLALGLLVAHLAAESVSLFRAKQAGAQLQASIQQVFNQAMPGENAVEPRRQMQARLAQIRGSASGPQHFLRALQSLAGAVGGRADTRVDALSYRDATLDLKVTAPSVDDLARLSQSISHDGLTADLQSSNPAAHGVEGRLQIRAPRGRP